jgi:multicomponent Na+:H+ antiporter subunit A
VAVVREEVPAPREAVPSRPLPVDWLGWVACTVALAGFVLVLLGWVSGGIAFSRP